MWAVLDTTTRTFLASGKAVFRARRDDPGFDFASVAVECAKAVEVALNTLLVGPVARALRGHSRPRKSQRNADRILGIGHDGLIVRLARIA
jgi:hypothetical protein